MLEQLGSFALGLVLVALGANSLVKGAGGLALGLGVRPFVVGLVVVGFGTSVPELAINASSAWHGAWDLALGTLVGSNVANVGLVLGVSALAAPLAVRMRLVRVEIPLLLGASALLLLLAFDGRLGALDGAVLLAGFVALLVVVARGVAAEPEDVRSQLADEAQTRHETWRSVVRIALGVALLVYGAKWTVAAAIVLAAQAGMSQVVVGLTLVAVGAVLPELATSVAAALRGRGDVAVGTVVGSSLFNVLAILGATAVAQPLVVPRSLVTIEIPALIAFALVLYPMVRGDRTVARHEGAILACAYVVFLAVEAWLITR